MKNRIIALVLFIVFCLMTLSILFLVIERNERNLEIEELNKKIISSDSLSKIKIEKLNSIIDRKNSIKQRYDRILNLAAYRRNRLNEANTLYQFFRDIADEESWIKEMTEKKNV